MSGIFKDLFLQTGGYLPKYSWASHNSFGEHARHIFEIGPSSILVGSKNSVYTHYAGNLINIKLFFSRSLKLFIF